MDKDLELLRRKIDEATPKGDEEAQAASTASNAAKAMRLGTELLAGVGVGGAIGYFIDRAAGTSPIFLILCFFLGFAAGVRNILRGASNL